MKEPEVPPEDIGVANDLESLVVYGEIVKSEWEEDREPAPGQSVHVELGTDGVKLILYSKEDGEKFKVGNRCRVTFTPLGDDE